MQPDAPRSYQVTIRETALGSIRLHHGNHGPCVFAVGPQECTHHLTAAEAREAAAALLAVADEIEPPPAFDWSGLAIPCGDPIKEGCEHVMTGGCLMECFRGPCAWEPYCLGFPTIEDLDRHFPPAGMCGCGADVRHKVLDLLCAEVADGKSAKQVAEEMGIEWAAAVAAYRVWDPERGGPRASARYRDADGKWQSVP